MEEKTEKKYYWLKLPNDFFSSKRIKKLKSFERGDTYIIIYLKMQLKALKTNGFLYFDKLYPDFAEELALDIDENPEDVKNTIQFLMSCGLLECDENGEVYFLTYLPNCIGSETAASQRGKKYRANLTEEQKEKERERARLGMQKIREEQKNNDVTNVLRTCYERVTNVEIEKEKEKEIEIENNIEKKSENFFPGNNNKKQTAEKIIDLYNKNCPSLPKVTKLTDQRIKSINARLKDNTEQDIIKVFQLAENSDFLKGKNDNGWVANFDWIIKPNNFIKVLENNYSNKPKQNNETPQTALKKSNYDFKELQKEIKEK